MLVEENVDVSVLMIDVASCALTRGMPFAPGHSLLKEGEVNKINGLA